MSAEQNPDAEFDPAAIAKRKAIRRLVAIEGDVTTPGYGDAFMRTYLPHYTQRVDGTYVPPAAWHPDFDQRVFGTLGSGVRGVFLAPRGFAKSTEVSLKLPLIALARRLKRYVLMIQETGPQSKQAMSQVIHELDTNEMLLADFPHLARAVDPKGQPVADRDDDIAFASGARLQALGAGGSLRGRRNQQQRPDLVLIDDLEDDEHVRTRYQRDKLDDWLSSALLGALAPDADVYMVGTLLHHDAVLARKMAQGAPWSPYRYEAVTDRAAFQALMVQVDAAIEHLVETGSLEPGSWDEAQIRGQVDADVLAAAEAASTWPEYRSALALAKQRKEMGGAAFSRELLHEPVNTEDKKFPREHFRWRDMRSRLLAADEGEFKGVRLTISIDPAIGEKRTNDYTAIVVTAQVEPGTYDVLDVLRGRWSEAKIAQRAHDQYQLYRRYNPTIVAEAAQAQAWLGQRMRDDYNLPVKDVRPEADKIVRAAAPSTLYENHQVYHDEALRDGDFEQELDQFPVAEHDDQVDALVYGLKHMMGKPRPRARQL